MGTRYICHIDRPNGGRDGMIADYATAIAENIRKDQEKGLSFLERWRARADRKEAAYEEARRQISFRLSALHIEYQRIGDSSTFLIGEDDPRTADEVRRAATASLDALFAAHNAPVRFRSRTVYEETKGSKEFQTYELLRRNS